MNAGSGEAVKMIFRRKEKRWYLIAGLGNPGREYRENRHNAGFFCINHLAECWSVPLAKSQSKALVASTRFEHQDVILAKPQTFMNKVGHSIAALVRFYKVDPLRLLIIYDDLDLPAGQIRMRPFGGSGGHRGMQSIIESMGSSEFPRVRIGIGRPPGRMDPADYVLQDFNDDEKILIEIALRHCHDCIKRFLTDGIEAAMTYCNTGQDD
jgi:PTH1 family peptidyl-tRNA hydrolase